MSNKIKKLKAIKSEIVILTKSLMNSKFQKSTAPLEKTSSIKNARYKIATLKTHISKINGVPLIGYALSIAKFVKRSKLTILSSDSKNYLKIGSKYSPNIIHLK